jgi:glycine dehydrogenase subunit 1
MLKAIGASSLEELFASSSDELRLKRPLDLPPALSEMELAQHMQALAAKNAHIGQKVCFLGGGAYDHFVPAVVDAIASRGEFYTSYTPYQPEVSQGNLQVMFEYQTLICQLTGWMSPTPACTTAAARGGRRAAGDERHGRPSKVGRRRERASALSRDSETYFASIGAKLVTVAPRARSR